MKYFTKLIEKFGKALKIETVPLPQARKESASMHRSGPVQVSAEQPLAPGGHAKEAPSAPAIAGD